MKKAEACCWFRSASVSEASSQEIGFQGQPLSQQPRVHVKLPHATLAGLKPRSQVRRGEDLDLSSALAPPAMGRLALPSAFL